MVEMVKIWYIWVQKNIAMLKSMKKPDPKATPDQIKMTKRLKDIQSKQRNSPEGKAFTQEMLAKSKQTSDDMKKAALARREQSNENIDEMGRQAMESMENKFGEEKFGPDYKGMGLSVGRKRKPGQVSERTYFKDYGEDNREEIEKQDDGSIRVTRKGKYATFADLEPTEREEYSEPGRRVYRTTVKDYAKKQQEALKARGKYLMNQAQPQIDKMMAEIEAAKAKAKAGGNK
jgi:hypothetical protein